MCFVSAQRTALGIHLLHLLRIFSGVMESTHKFYIRTVPPSREYELQIEDGQI
jgi:hypothetical protein